MTGPSGRHLRGRTNECEALDQLLESARGGRSQVLVLHGEAGVGKTALLDYLSGRAAGCRLARSQGVESEMELPFAGLHQLCSPFLGMLDRLPIPQRDALRTAFGMREGAVPDRFMVGLAVLSLLSEVADEQPLICVIDDAQWLDRASTQTLTFVARRLLAESVAVVFALREFGAQQDLSGLSQLAVLGLLDADARALLQSAVTWKLDAEVRDRIVAEARGNPLALLEIPRGLTASQLAFGPDVGDLPLITRIEQGFLRRLQPLPLETQRLLLLAAAEPVGDPALMWRSAARLEIDHHAALPAIAAGLFEVGAQVRFRHPLVRSAIYRAASDDDRRAVHRALAESTDAAVDPDRRAWHRSNAATGPDDAVADELESSAGRAQNRGGMAAAASFLEHSSDLTVDPGVRAHRALAAAQAHKLAGAFDPALALLAQAISGPLTPVEAARAELLRAQIVFTTTFGADAPPMLVAAAEKLGPLDVRLSRDTYLEAMASARFAATGDGRIVGVVAQAARHAPLAPEPPTATDLLLDGLAVRYTDGMAAALPSMRTAVDTFGRPELPPAEGLQWLWYAGMTALELWDDDAWLALAQRHVQLVRDIGVLPLLPIALSTLSAVHVCAGEMREAAALNDEIQRLTELLGGRLGPYALLNFTATRGREDAAVPLIESAIADAAAQGQGLQQTIANYAGSILYNGLGRYPEALAAAERAGALPVDRGGNMWALAELVEAAHHSREPERGLDALRQLSHITEATGTDWGLGLQAGLQALFSDGDEAERLFLESIDRLGRTRVHLALARAHLLYGEWLRRENRRLDARGHLRTAFEMLATMGVEAFAERARRELVATGEIARKRTVETREDLTAQEEQIARLAADGHTNPEIGGKLFLSARTVEWHLRKVFTKLDITSRRQLKDALPAPTRTAASA